MKNWKNILTFSSLLLWSLAGFTQQFVKRLILFGDAGEQNPAQSMLIEKAVSLVVPDSSVVFFLGDNIYPKGMSIEPAEQTSEKQILFSQYAPFRALSVPVYFLAGNHDWNVSRPGGLAKLKAQENFILNQQDPQLHFLPTAGDPGPVSLALAPGLTVLIYDSEYWLYPYHADSIDLQQQREEFESKLKHLFNANKENVVLVLSHHPMATYGEHSLRFGWKQHIFPLTRLNKSLYIPLPIIGSLYPLWRGILFKSAEDLPSAPYQHMVKGVLHARGGHRNTLFAAGHDHGLQYIEQDSLRQIVSGAGSKSSFIVTDKHLKYKYQKQGFTILDYYSNGDLRLMYFIFDGDQVQKSFETRIPKQQ